MNFNIIQFWIFLIYDIKYENKKYERDKIGNKMQKKKELSIFLLRIFIFIYSAFFFLFSKYSLENLGH